MPPQEAPVKKLTLNLEEEEVRLARELAREDGVSVSALFANLLRRRIAMRRRKDLPPLTRKLSGILKNPEKKSDQELVEDAVLERHGFKK